MLWWNIPQWETLQTSKQISSTTNDYMLSSVLLLCSKAQEKCNNFLRSENSAGYIILVLVQRLFSKLVIRICPLPFQEHCSIVLETSVNIFPDCHGLTRDHKFTGTNFRETETKLTSKLQAVIICSISYKDVYT